MRAPYRADEVPLLVQRFGGRATWRQLLRHSTQHHVRTAVERGLIVRVTRGVYSGPGMTPERAAAARARGALCLESAAPLHGLPVLRRGGPLRVTVPPGSRPPAQPGVRYRWSPLGAEEIERSLTGELRTILDCAAYLPFAEALAVADAALHLGLFAREQLLREAERLRGPGRPQRLRVLRLADAGAASPLESALRALLLQAGITWFTVQLLVRGDGWSVQVDLGNPDLRIAIEAEGFAYHAGSQRVFDRDCVRYNELVRHGWRVLRFTWQQVVHRPERVVRTVRDVSASPPPRRPRPSPG